MTKVLNLSRREVVAGGIAAAGLVLGVYVGFREFPVKAASAAPAMAAISRPPAPTGMPSKA